MSDHEEIVLVGGPFNGDVMRWDGGDYVSIMEPPKFKQFNGRRLFEVRHIYQRARFSNGTRSQNFIYQGEC